MYINAVAVAQSNLSLSLARSRNELRFFGAESRAFSNALHPAGVRHHFTCSLASDRSKKKVWGSVGFSFLSGLHTPHGRSSSLLDVGHPDVLNSSLFDVPELLGPPDPSVGRTPGTPESVLHLLIGTPPVEVFDRSHSGHPAGLFDDPPVTARLPVPPSLTRPSPPAEDARMVKIMKGLGKDEKKGVEKADFHRLTIQLGGPENPIRCPSDQALPVEASIVTRPETSKPQ